MFGYDSTTWVQSSCNKFYIPAFGSENIEEKKEEALVNIVMFSSPTIAATASAFAVKSLSKAEKEKGKTMLHGKSCVQETYYDILSVKEDATYEEIRTCYRSAILNTHPDKLQNGYVSSQSESGSEDRFCKVQKAWEILSNLRSRALYDSELRASRQDDMVAAEDVSLEDMMVEDGGDIIELFYQCRCGDYFTIDSLELGKMGYSLLRDGSNISLHIRDGLPASVVLPCGSCSLKVRLLINSDVCVSINDDVLRSD